MDIREARKSLGLTQQEFADAIGVDRTVVCKYEKGTIKPSKKTAERIDYLMSVGDATLIIECNKEERSKEESQKHLEGYLKRLIIQGAGGCCELCGAKAPFLDNNQRPYLCVYQVVKDNVDVAKKYVALCPNCFEKIKVLARTEDIGKLKEKAMQHLY